MSTSDLATIREAIRFRGDYQNVRKFPNTAVNKEIQKSFGEFYALVDSTHEGYWDTEGTITTIANQAYIATPTGTWRVKGVDRYDGTDTIELRRITIGHRNRYGSTTDTPVAYRLSSRGVELYPTPNAAIILRISYTPVAPALQEAESRDWFNGWDDYVIESTLAKLDRREGKPINERMMVIKDIETRVKSEASGHNSQEPEYLVIRENGDIGGHWPWGDVD